MPSVMDSGCLDEGIQAVLPNRVYDNMDVLFNTLAATLIIGARWLLDFVRRRGMKARGKHVLRVMTSESCISGTSSISQD